MVTRIDKNAVRVKRHYRQRRHIVGTPERPRLNVYRSTNHIYAQVIDDHPVTPWSPLPRWTLRSEANCPRRPRPKQRRSWAS